MNKTNLSTEEKSAPLREGAVIASAFSVGGNVTSQEWNHKGCQVCHENKRRGYIVNENCQIHYNGECIVLTMNKALKNSGKSHYNFFYQLMDDVLKPLFPKFTFHWEARTDGRFYITNEKGDWLYLHWSKDIYDCYYIGNASF
jgi:hypothetical protein